VPQGNAKHQGWHVAHPNGRTRRVPRATLEESASYSADMGLLAQAKGLASPTSLGECDVASAEPLPRIQSRPRRPLTALCYPSSELQTLLDELKSGLPSRLNRHRAVTKTGHGCWPGLTRHPQPACSRPCYVPSQTRSEGNGWTTVESSSTAPREPASGTSHGPGIGPALATAAEIA
jgi:hypothetical protein